MHLVALYKGFIILQVSAGVPDVGPDVFIQIPAIKTAFWCFFSCSCCTQCCTV